MPDKNNNAYDAIVFDMDGVLFDSETLHMVAWRESLQEQGIIYDDGFFLDWVGIPDEDLGVYLDEKHPQENPSGFFLENKRSLFRDIVKRDLKAFDGLEDELKKLSSHVPLAIATSSQRFDMDLMLGVTGLSRFFSESCTHGDVTKHKPDPQVYLLAAKKLGIAPERCIAIDDSPSGVQSAVSAGMFTVGITSSFEAERLSVAHRIFENTVESCKWLRETYFPENSDVAV